MPRSVRHGRPHAPCATFNSAVGGAQIIVMLHGRTSALPDDMVGLQIDQSKVHLFDQGSGQRID